MTSTDVNPLHIDTSLRPMLRGTTESSGVDVENVPLPTDDASLLALAVIAALLVIALLRFLTSKKPETVAPVEVVAFRPPPSPPRQPPGFQTETARPVPQKRCVEGSAYVTDGDTIVIRKTQIRLFGIDAPELNHPYGQKAKWAMVKLCKGHKIRAEITDIDHYGRTVARCILPDGRDLSAELVKMGLAIDWPKFSGGEYKHIEVPGIRKKLWLADARQKGKMYVWEQFEYQQSRKTT